MNANTPADNKGDGREYAEDCDKPGAAPMMINTPASMFLRRTSAPPIMASMPPTMPMPNMWRIWRRQNPRLRCRAYDEKLDVVPDDE